MTRFNRGYSEVTFARVAVLTGAREGIIHKEFHLCTGDPVLLGPGKVEIIGNTNFDISDQMSDMGMEAIHAKAANDLAARNISIRVKNAFEPEHPGTVISRDFVSSEPRVEMITGRDDTWRSIPRVRLAFDIVTATMALVSWARFLVQYYLYDTDQEGLLAAARIAMGWPVFVVTSSLIYLAIRTAVRGLAHAERGT